ncbi:hypothetical protein DYBT9275_00174 [Dyadobacter sp. CECT 9275]|uniref:Restriction endonuclease domain-containing protein n=1 Tax=Dyadobacter helix TaxID=2822344 RepID=A0A916J7V6_9BACT|nr:Uma2 family endonuclease [Dyadobacter sp. CECT 9275]CAG4988860.1 hypothetical protein DYBT9275_00174 [Dyadobacter sp. CECT 9275]
MISKITEKTDRITKLNEYRLLPSLQYYLVAEQESCFVGVYTREGDRWYVEFYEKPEDKIPLPFFGLELPLASIYRKIDFQPEH